MCAWCCWWLARGQGGACARDTHCLLPHPTRMCAGPGPGRSSPAAAAWQQVRRLQGVCEPLSNQPSEGAASSPYPTHSGGTAGAARSAGASHADTCAPAAAAAAAEPPLRSTRGLNLCSILACLACWAACCVVCLLWNSMEQDCSKLLQARTHPHSAAKQVDTWSDVFTHLSLSKGAYMCIRMYE